MTLEYATYPIAPRGLATSFTEAEVPDDYALTFLNRFINAAGGAEKRQGLVAYTNTIPSLAAVTGLHEMMLPSGVSVLFASANGIIYKYTDPTWTAVYSLGTPTGRYRSVQMGKKLIFTNGIDRNIYTEDSTTFKELKGIIERGRASSGTDENSLQDANITNWVLDSDAHINDLVYNQTRNGYGIITAIATASVSHTLISTSGGGARGIGIVSVTASSGDTYEIIDLVEQNVIPTGLDNDNFGIAALTTVGSIEVAAVTDWTITGIASGNYIRNTTANWITQVTAVSTGHISIIPAQVQSGDSLLFFKAAMPVATRSHVHFGRLYMIDTTDQRTAVISGPDNPEDVTTDAGTLDSTSVHFGDMQPTADKLQSFVSFQRFLGICGLRNVYLFQGTNPIQDVSANTIDFSIVGLFPQGVVCSDGAVSIGNNLLYMSVDGVQSISLYGNASILGRDNISEPLRVTLRDAIANTAPEDIFVFHYPRRSWFCAKVGSELYVYNYTPYIGKNSYDNQNYNPTSNKGSWAKFDGLFAQMHVYYVTADGTLICAGDNGKVYKFDQNTYDDAGQTYSTSYQTGWLSMTPSAGRTPQTKQGHYIKPIVNSGESILYTVTAEAPFFPESFDSRDANPSASSTSIGSATIGSAVIGGSAIVDKKMSLRWRGKEVRFTFMTNDQLGPDVLSRFTVFYTMHGVR